MAIDLPPLGELLKMRIFSFNDSNRLGLPVLFFDALYNPSTYTVSYPIHFTERQAAGTGGTSSIYGRRPSKEYTFDFILDATGASDPGVVLGLAESVPVLGEVVSAVSINLQVQQFLSVTYDYSREKHRPHYLKLLWGTGFILDCIMTKAEVTYSLFGADGRPLRAKINATFRESQEPDFWQRLLSLLSPDLTRERQVAEGENLPLLSKKEYDDSKHYVELARFNKLKNFRRIRTGQTLKFPPLRPESA